MHRTKRIPILPRTSTLGTALLLALVLMLSALAADGGRNVAEAQETGARENGASLRPGAVFAMTNDPTNNEIVAFGRGTDGILTPAGSFSTGGRGSGLFEQSANGLILGEQSPNNLGGSYKFLYATNAGSNSISVFRVESDGLELVDVEPSNGDHPISVTVHHDVVYVLNGGSAQCTGGTPNITGFRASPRGELTPIPGSTRPVLGGPASGCSQVSFNKNGNVLVVTEKEADKIATYTVDGNGLASQPISNESTGVGPFGFTFTQRGQLLTAENFGGTQGQGGAASYDVERNGALTPLGPTARNGRSDTCWIVNTDDGKFAFVTNAMSGDISSYRVDPDGTLALLDPIAATIRPIAADIALSKDSRYLYARSASDGTISVFRVENDGALTRLQDIGGLPPGGGAIGIAAS